MQNLINHSIFTAKLIVSSSSKKSNDVVIENGVKLPDSLIFRKNKISIKIDNWKYHMRRKYILPKR